MKEVRSIVLINCYFGKLPWYFDHFIHSCAFNPTVDFIVFSDDKKTKCPTNVKLIHFTLSDFNNLASSKLGFSVNVKNGYKLCDFKPAFGVLFSEYLIDYSFWGICDIDIIFGRIREFITDELLETYDVINTRHDYLTGSFLLFRNTQRINTLFTKSKDYKIVFTTDSHLCFDECNFKHGQLQQEGISIFDLPCQIESMEHVIGKELLGNKINVFYDFLIIDGLVGDLKWDHGVFVYSNKLEILLYHLIQYKTNKYSKPPFWKNIPNLYFIDMHQFRRKSKNNFFGFFNYMFNQQILIIIFRIKQRLDYLISYLFNSRFNKLTEGNYKHKLGDSYLSIGVNDLHQNTISSHVLFKNTRPLLRSVFKPKEFYEVGVSHIKYRYFGSVNGVTKKFELIHQNGNTDTYELVENS